jgi:hypothetical protein
VCSSQPVVESGHARHSDDAIDARVSLDRYNNLTNPVVGRPPLKLNDRLYFVLSMIIYLLNTVNPNQTFKSRLRGLLVKYPNVDVKAMGFPGGWETEPLWDWMNVPLG